jgi:hypothetical protein
MVSPRVINEVESIQKKGSIATATTNMRMA